jgi:hypothetical protein
VELEQRRQQQQAEHAAAVPRNARAENAPAAAGAATKRSAAERRHRLTIHQQQLAAISPSATFGHAPHQSPALGEPAPRTAAASGRAICGQSEQLLARARAHARPAPARVGNVERLLDRVRERRRSSTSARNPGLARHDLVGECRRARGATTGSPCAIASKVTRLGALVAGRVHEQVGALVERVQQRLVHAAEQVDARAQQARARRRALERRAAPGPRRRPPMPSARAARAAPAADESARSVTSKPL